MDKEKAKLHHHVMRKLQAEWEENIGIHKLSRNKPVGVRSSQISALVAFLIEAGIISKENLK